MQRGLWEAPMGVWKHYIEGLSKAARNFTEPLYWGSLMKLLCRGPLWSQYIEGLQERCTKQFWLFILSTFQINIMYVEDIRLNYCRFNYVESMLLSNFVSHPWKKRQIEVTFHISENILCNHKGVFMILYLEYLSRITYRSAWIFNCWPRYLRKSRWLSTSESNQQWPVMWFLSGWNKALIVFNNWLEIVKCKNARKMLHMESFTFSYSL